jgi:rSAM/selenodomain-associated transferase 1
MSAALIVFAKVPEPGRVKTRLVPSLTEEEAAELYAAFLRDALITYQELDASVRVYISPSATGTLPADLIPHAFEVKRQTGEHLGERMQHAFLETFAAGYSRAVIVGTDHPTLPLMFVEEAFRTLDEPLTVSIGPSEDGGYYLLGMNEFYPQVFAGMTYSHPQVFAETVERLRPTRARLVVLPMWYDVDTFPELQRLAGELEQTEEPLLHTRMVVKRLRADGRLEGA